MLDAVQSAVDANPALDVAVKPQRTDLFIASSVAGVLSGRRQHEPEADVIDGGSKYIDGVSTEGVAMLLGQDAKLLEYVEDQCAEV